MDVTQRRSLNGLNYSNKNTMNFFKKTLDPMIALTLVKLIVYLVSRGNVSNLVFTPNGDLDPGSGRDD